MVEGASASRLRAGDARHAPGLAWDDSQLYTDGKLTVIPEPGTLMLIAVGLPLLLKRRRKA